MGKLRTFSGKDLLKTLALFGFDVCSQNGSHVKTRRILADGTRQTLTVPFHDEIDKGTLRAIYSQAVRHIPESELRSHFFTD